MPRDAAEAAPTPAAPMTPTTVLTAIRKRLDAIVDGTDRCHELIVMDDEGDWLHADEVKP